MKNFELLYDFDPFHYHKGVSIGRITELIKEEAGKIGLPISGNGRKIRLELASQLVDRKIDSYNDLTDVQIYSIKVWASENRSELRNWLGREYGYQEKLI